jgi:hypothetical protein
MTKIFNKIRNKIDELKTKKYWKDRVPKILASLVKGVVSNISKK